jgi:repressor LexA
MSDQEQKQIFAKNLNNQLLIANKTQKEVADAINISPQTFNTWCQGIALPRMGKIQLLADYFRIAKSDLLERKTINKQTIESKGITIPVLGYVRAGYPIYAEENIIDYEEISKAMATKGEFFGLRICGNSMEPRMFENDVVIVRKQDTIESGEIAVVLVNGDEATVKKIIKSEDGIMLVPLNANCTYDPHFYSAKDINELPVCILGKVVEVRGKL